MTIYLGIFTAIQKNDELFEENRELLEKVRGLKIENSKYADIKKIIDAKSLSTSFNKESRNILKNSLSTSIGHLSRYNDNIYSTNFALELYDLSSVTAGNVVMNNRGVIGRITEINDSRADVLSIYDPRSHIPVKLKASGIHCVAVGGGKHRGVLGIMHLNNDVDPIAGEVAMISEISDVIPYGIELGEVSYEGQEAIIRPFANSSHIGSGFVRVVSIAHNRL